MTEAASNMSVFQTIIVLFGAGGFCTAGGVIYSFGKKAQKITDMEKDLKEGKEQFEKTNEILVEHGQLLAVINDRTERTEKLLEK